VKETHESIGRKWNKTKWMKERCVTSEATGN
jgi:hypothetical protein